MDYSKGVTPGGPSIFAWNMYYQITALGAEIA